MPDASSHVYVIGCPPPSAGPVKIGWTNNVQARLNQLRTDGTITPEFVDRGALEVLYTCNGDRTLERALHYRFQQLRVCGEWFRLDPAVAPREVRMAISEIPPIGTPQHGEWRDRIAGRSRTRRAIAHPHVEPGTAIAVVEPDPEQATADKHYRLFTVWVKAGFTEDQALRMVTYMATNPG